MLSHGEGCREDVAEGGGEGASHDTSPTSKIYTTWARILSNRNVFCTPRGGGKTARSNAPGAFLVFLFFRGHLPQTPGFRSARQILAVSFATRARTCIFSDPYKFYTRRRGRTTAGSNALGAFLVFWWSLAPDLRFSLFQTNLRCKLPLYLLGSCLE